MIEQNHPSTPPQGSSSSWLPEGLRNVYQQRIPSPEEEQDSLAKIRRQLMQDFPAPAKAKPSRPLLWTGLAAVPLAALLLFFLRSETLDPLHVEGIAADDQGIAQKKHFAIASKEKRVTLAAQGRWSLSLEKQSQIELTRRRAHQTHIRLLRGHLRAFVEPQRGEDFAVTHQAWTIRVKGTRFAVHQEGAWLRVYLWSGAVELQHKTQRLTLQPEEAARIHLATHRVERFPIPPHPLDPKAHLPWLKKQPPALAARYLLDWSQKPPFPDAPRARFLRQSLDALLPHLNAKELLTLGQTFTHLEEDPLAQETDLYAILQRCHTHKPLACVPLSRWFIQRFRRPKMPPFLARIYFLHAAARLHDPHTQRAALLELKAYPQRFPQGLDLRRTCQLIQKTLHTSPPPFLLPLQKELGKTTPWFKTHCASLTP